VPDVGPPGSRIVGAVVGLGGKLILTVPFFGPFDLSGSSPPESKPTAGRIGGRGGFIEPEVAGFGVGLSSLFCIDAQCCLMFKSWPSPRGKQQ
jgi:hypothetical protein